MLKRTLLIACAIAVATSTSAGAITVYGLTTSNQLISFDSATPGAVTNLGTISQAGIVDIDFSPVNNQLYGATSSGNLYTISLSNASATLAQSPTGTVPGDFNVTDADFNPAADRIRLFGVTDRNFRMTPNVGATNPPTATPGAVTDDGTFSNTAVDLQSSAYTNNFDGTATTTLYSIDTALDQLIIHTVGPAFSTVGAVGSGLGVAVGSLVGFDIGPDGVAYMSNGVNLYTINLGAGTASSIGTVGDSSLSSIAVVTPEPGTAALVGLGLLALGASRRARR